MPPFGATDSTAASWNKKGSLVKADFTEMDSFGGLLLMEKMLHQLIWRISHGLQGFSTIPGGCFGFRLSTVSLDLRLKTKMIRLSRGLFPKSGFVSASR